LSTSVRVRFRDYLKPGRDANGSPVQNKEMVVGRLVVTSFNGGGEGLTPSDMGLENFDYLQLSVEDGVGSKSGEPRTATFSHTAQEFYVFQSNSTALTSAKDWNVNFVAVGNSLRAPQFL